MHWEGGIIKMYYFQCFPSLVLDRVWEYSSHSENWLPQKTSKEGRDCKQLYLRFLHDGKQTEIGKPPLILHLFTEITDNSVFFYPPLLLFQSQNWGDFFTVMPMLSHGYTTVMEQNCFKTQSMKFLFRTQKHARANICSVSPWKTQRRNNPKKDPHTQFVNSLHFLTW